MKGYRRKRAYGKKYEQKAWDLLLVAINTGDVTGSIKTEIKPGVIPLSFADAKVIPMERRRKA